MLGSVAVVLQEPVALFELGVVAEVFGIDRTADGVPRFDYRVCTEFPNTAMSAGVGTTLTAASPLSAAADADLVAVPSSSLTDAPSAAVLDVLTDAVTRGAYVLSVCSGAFAVAAAGVLKGRTVATHWRYADLLSSRYPDLTVNSDVLYTQDGTIITSAGTAAGIDACLHLVRAEHGTTVANRIARRMVVAAHRPGGQKQFVEAPVEVTPGHSLQPVLDWAEQHLHEPLSIADLARRTRTSTRTLIRRFDTELGTSPHTWLTRRRTSRAQELLEQSRLPIEDIARASGFGSAPLMRHHFVRALGITPSHYRRQFNPTVHNDSRAGFATNHQTRP